MWSTCSQSCRSLWVWTLLQKPDLSVPDLLGPGSGQQVSWLVCGTTRPILEPTLSRMELEGPQHLLAVSLLICPQSRGRDTLVLMSLSGWTEPAAGYSVGSYLTALLSRLLVSPPCFTCWGTCLTGAVPSPSVHPHQPQMNLERLIIKSQRGFTVAFTLLCVDCSVNVQK